MRGPRNGLSRLGLLVPTTGIAAANSGDEDPAAPEPDGDRGTAGVSDVVNGDCSSCLVAEADVPVMADRTFGPPRNGRDRLRDPREEATGGKPDHERTPGKPPGLAGRKKPRMVPGKPPKRSVRHRRRRNA
jgi:hypothetical protein